VKLSIIVPVLDEAAVIAATLQALQARRGAALEVIVVDGGSADATMALAQPLADKLITAPRGRARQMNAGAAAATGDVLVFLHADTILPEGAPAAIVGAIPAEQAHPPTFSEVARIGSFAWGRFDVAITGQAVLLRVVAALMNVRSRVTGVATGDQAMFMTRAAYDAVGGFPDQPLMEDIEMSRRLKLLGAPVCLKARVSTSGRRWERRGIWRTIFLMWRLRWAYFRGERPESLVQRYY
jgi:rSAM/selenodomain-associated transferase 2